MSSEDDIARRIRLLEDRVVCLELLNGLAGGLFRKTSPAPLEPAFSPERRRNPYPVCTRCGLHLGEAVGHVCPNHDCPLQRGQGAPSNQDRLT